MIMPHSFPAQNNGILATAHEYPFDSHVDVAELLCRVENDHDLLQEIVALFNDEFPKAYNLLLHAVARQDLQQIIVAAHTLKGMLSSLSFVTASASAMRVEHLARDGQFEGVTAEVDYLARTSLAAQESLLRYCSETLV